MNQHDHYNEGELMTTLYKAVRPDGTDFWTRTIQWAPPVGHEGEWIVRHPNGKRRPGTHPRTFLSVSTTPTNCSGMEWPCRLLTVEPVEGYPTGRPHREDFPHRVASMAWRVTGERPAHEALGPQGEHMARFLDNLADAARDAARDTAWAAAMDTAQGAAWTAAQGAAWAAAQGADQGAAWTAAQGAAWSVAGFAAQGAAWDAAWSASLDAAGDAAAALVVRDLIPRETYEILTRPVRLAGITVHPDDPDLKEETR